MSQQNADSVASWTPPEWRKQRVRCQPCNRTIRRDLLHDHVEEHRARVAAGLCERCGKRPGTGDWCEACGWTTRAQQNDGSVLGECCARRLASGEMCDACGKTYENDGSSQETQ